MKNTIKKISALVLSLCMILSLFTICAFADEREEVDFKAYIWSDELLSTIMSEQYYFEVSPETTTFESNEVYVVRGTVTVDNRIECGQNVKLVLTDGSVLNVDKGIHVAGSLDIYTEKDGNGTINSTLERENNSFSNIGINTGDSGCDIGVHGGDINLIHNGDESCINAGTGSFTQYAGDISSIANWGNGIKAGTINICSGKLTTFSNGGAGITATTVNIYDGELDCTGSSGAAVEGKDITINGGEVMAKSSSGAAIGGGDAKSSMVNISSCNSITINNGFVQASSYTGAVIGSGFAGSCNTITINNGKVSLANTYGGALGSAVGGTCKTVCINGGTVLSIGAYAHDPQGFAFRGTDGFGCKAGTMPEIKLGKDIKLHYRASLEEPQKDTDYVTSTSKNIKTTLQDKKSLSVIPSDVYGYTGAILSGGSTTIIIACVALLIGAAAGLLIGKKLFGKKA